MASLTIITEFSFINVVGIGSIYVHDVLETYREVCLSGEFADLSPRFVLQIHVTPLAIITK
jgi:hypothetical protein